VGGGILYSGVHNKYYGGHQLLIYSVELVYQRVVHLALAIFTVDHSEVQRQFFNVSIVMLQGQQVPDGERNITCTSHLQASCRLKVHR